MPDINYTQAVVDISGKLITTTGILIGGVYAFLKTSKYRELEECIEISIDCRHSMVDAKASGTLQIAAQIDVRNVGGSVVHGRRVDYGLDFVPAVSGAASFKDGFPLDGTGPGRGPDFKDEHYTIDKGERSAFVFPCQLPLPSPTPLTYRFWVEYTCKRRLPDGNYLTWVYERMFPLEPPPK